jgi:hypothetical protein
MATSNGSTGRRIVMRQSKIHGRGVFAARWISAGERVVEYKGRRITWDEADGLYPDEPDAPAHTFLFAVDKDIVIDANRDGNVARWINHSCDPNCEAVTEDHRVFIEAIRDIAPGEELSYDYNITFEERHTRALKRRYRCICGAESCKGTLLGDKR